jgi:exodeoxyribonuclease-3
VKIATFNVNGINGRLPVLLKWLALASPDIVVLQELKAPQKAFPRAAIEKAGYQAIWHGQSRWNGVALLSRVGEIQETRRGLPGDPADRQSRYIEAAVGGVLIAGLYLPNGNPMPGPKFEYKVAWMARLADHLKTLVEVKAPVVVAGDFNIIPTDRDVYKPERWQDDALFAPEAKATYQRLLAQGWTDAIRDRHPDEVIFTYWDYWRKSFERNAGIRIDHLLLNPPAKRLLTAAEVDIRPRSWEKSSDHTPVWIELADHLSRQTRSPG